MQKSESRTKVKSTITPSLEADVIVNLESECTDPFASAKFPPAPLNPDLARTVLKEFCKECDPPRVEEAGCAVCGLLTPKTDMRPLKTIKGLLNMLITPGVTRRE
ncbi:hypothetical protein C0993_009951, partial [Termitomyces sp. T159_Od127]